MTSESDLDNKCLALRELIDKDITAADLRISLFVAVAKSYKYYSCLQPFLPTHMVDKQNSIEKLKQTLNELPSLLELDLSELSEDSINLLYWILCKQSDPSLRTLPASAFDSILAKAPSYNTFQRPDQIFEVVHRKDDPSEQAFQLNLHSFPRSYGYHGSKLFNFYSILNYGLQKNLHKNEVGEGIYLSQELRFSEMFSHYGFSWPKSTLGKYLACTALCEYIDNPEYVQYRKTVHCVNSEKYALVHNDALVQLRYLLVYQAVGMYDEKPSLWLRFLEESRKQIASYRCIGWIASNKRWLFAGGYLLMMLAVGLINSQSHECFFRSQSFQSD